MVGCCYLRLRLRLPIRALGPIPWGAAAGHPALRRAGTPRRKPRVGNRSCQLLAAVSCKCVLPRLPTFAVLSQRGPNVVVSTSVQHRLHEIIDVISPSGRWSSLSSGAAGLTRPPLGVKFGSWGSAWWSFERALCGVPFVSFWSFFCYFFVQHRTLKQVFRQLTGRF